MSKPEQRHCLPCSACCQGWLGAEIQGHKVSAGKPCPYSAVNGCSIYHTRPHDPCRTFVCSWLVDKSPLPDWMRPDQGGVIVLLSLLWHGRRVIFATPVGQTIPAHSLEWLKRYAQEHKRPLIFYERIIHEGVYTGMKRYGFGPPDFKRLVAEVTTKDPDLSLHMHSG